MIPPDPVQSLVEAVTLRPSGARMPNAAATFTVVPIITPAAGPPPSAAPADAPKPRPRHAARLVKDRSGPLPDPAVSPSIFESP